MAVAAHLGEGAVDGGLADAGAGAFDIAYAELGGEAADGVDDHLALGAVADGDGADAFLELAVAAEHHDAEEVLPPRDEIVAALMPVLGGGEEGVVVGALGALDHLLEADEAAYVVAGLVEEEECEEAGGAAIAIEERVDAEEIEDVCRDEEEGLDVAGGAGLEEEGVELFHGVWGLEGGEGLEAEAAGAIWLELGDLVVDGFPLAAAACGEAVEGLVHLEDECWGEGDGGGLDVDVLEDVAVAGDLLLGAVAGF